MLICKLLLRRHATRLTCSLTQTRHSSQVAVEPETARQSSEVRLSEHKPKKPKRQPFAKNLVMGKFDNEVLTYPEVQTHDRYKEFFEWLKPVEKYVNEEIDMREIDESCVIKDEIFEELKKLGVLRAAVNEEYGGLGLNNSEYAKLVETVSVVPVLGSFIAKRAAIAKLINDYGTQQQKFDLLPKLANGEIRPTLCFSDSVTGALSEPLNSKATRSQCETSFTIKARKPCVFDALKADPFIVLVHDETDAYAEDKDLIAFIVPRDTPGMKMERLDSSFGLRGIDTSFVTLDNVILPQEARLGTHVPSEELFVSILANGKTNVGAQSIGMLKRFLNLLVEHVINDKYFNSRRENEDSIHEIVGNVATTLYAAEAMTYLTAGLMDEYENQDTIVEQALVEYYCSRACRGAILQGINLLGASSYLKSEPFEQIIRDALSLGCYDRSAIDMKIFAALSSLQYAGKEIADNIRIGRNPLLFPIRVLREVFSFKTHKSLHLEDHLHPSLRIAASSLETSIHELRENCETLLTRHGAEVLRQRMDLGRLTDIMIEIYAMTAVIARASRSYCIGMRNHDEEMSTAHLFMCRTFDKVKGLTVELKDGNWANGDMMLRDIANKTFDSKAYFASHPLERNF